MSEPERPAAPPYRSTSGVEIRSVYGPEALDEIDPAAAIGAPGEYPYTRGIYPQGYRARP
ncbi:MAG: methylmalonyl-CoA mutase family protein, partial [Candidatus Limnocylindria bacterium]